MKQPELGLKILDVRQTKGLTQEELVTLCNVNVRTLQRIESGEVEPRGSTIRLISKALDFDFVRLSSNNDAEADAKEDNAIKSDYMRNLETAREIVIERYASLSHTSVEKIKSKLENEPIDSIVKKHNRATVLSQAFVLIGGVSLIIQFTTLLYARSITIALLIIVNLLLLIFFLNGLRNNLEIKNILQILREIGYIRT